MCWQIHSAHLRRLTAIFRDCSSIRLRNLAAIAFICTVSTAKLTPCMLVRSMSGEYRLHLMVSNR